MRLYSHWPCCTTGSARLGFKCYQLESVGHTGSLRPFVGNDIECQFYNQQEPTVEHRELCSMLRGSLDARGVWGRMDTCMCMSDPLHCPPETIITLSISYTPIRNKKLKKKGIPPARLSGSDRQNRGYANCTVRYMHLVFIIQGRCSLYKVPEMQPTRFTVSPQHWH